MHQSHAQRKLLLSSMVVLLSASLFAFTTGAQGAPNQPAVAPQHTPHWMVQILFDKGTDPWTLSTFQKFAQEGITDVEINMDWDAVEPSPGVFNWSTLKTYLLYCQKTHLKLVPIFWEYGYAGNPPTWLPGGNEVTSTGALAPEPAFWSQRNIQDYAAYIGHTLSMMNQNPGFGGAYIDYGWLDAGYGPQSSGIAGYAPQDVSEFHVWLGDRYHTITALNDQLGTDYASFSAVPAFIPGQAHFPLYEQFRTWSYGTLLGKVLKTAREATNQPLYIYYGGGMSDVGSLGNLPDVVFQLAKRYHAVVNMDTASHTAFDALFGSLSEAYGVPLLNEWTPVPGNLQELAQWLGQYPLEGQNRDGEDYYLYGGTGYQPTFEPATYPSYLSWHATLAKVKGQLPSYPVGIMVGYDQVLTNDLGAGITGGVGQLGSYIRTYRPAANVFTDLSVLDGAVSLNQFHTIIDWNGDLVSPNLNPQLKHDLDVFEQHGGTIIPGPTSANANAFALLNQPDGQYTVQTILGQQAVVSELGVGGTADYAQYLYFKVPSTVVPSTEPDVTVSVTYANNQTNNGFFLQYDSSDTAAPVNGAYDTAYPVATTTPVEVTDTGKYATAKFAVTNALFEGGENGGADFRIAAEHPGLAVSSVTVSANGQSQTFTPNELSRLSVPAQMSLTPSDPDVEAFASIDHQTAYIVLSNIGASSFTGTLTVPSAIVQTWFPHTGRNKAPISSHALLGVITPTASVYGPSWHVSIPSGSIGVLAVHD